MPDEDFFSLIQHVQAKRIDEQRVGLASAQEEGEREEQPVEEEKEEEEEELDRQWRPSSS